MVYPEKGALRMMPLSDFLFWISENLWALILHIAGKSSFPKPLSQDEERRLIERMLRGDLSARDLLIEHNLRLVAHIAKKYQNSALDSDDLVSVGSIGLIKAVNTFRPEAGKLTTYASRCIENEILMQLRANRKNRNTMLLDEPIGTDKDGNEIRLMDLLGTDKNAVVDQVEVSIESERAVRLIARVLDERERKVVELRYGLTDGILKPQHEVARALGISRSYVSRIEKKALLKLRKALGG